MKKLPLFLISLLIFLSVAYISSGWAVGWYLEPRLERLLTDWFGLPVEIEGLYGHPWPGRVSARRVIFHNPSGFGETPHLDTLGLWGEMDLLKLRDKEVVVPYVVLRRPQFLIERRGPDPEKEVLETEQVSNINQWLYHMKEKRRVRREKREAAGIPRGKSWHVWLGKIEIENGTFIYQSEPKDEKAAKRFIFRNLHGALTGFEWPTPDPEGLLQHVELEGDFGDRFGTPFQIIGDANFATKQVSFDLKGIVREGELDKQSSLLEGLPVQVKGGHFDLNIHAVCRSGELEAENELILRELELDAGANPTDRIWEVPVKAWMAFLTSEKVVYLDVRLKGKITDPKFEVYRAFQKAFQDSLRKKTANSVEKIKEISIRFTQGAEKLVFATPTKAMKSGIGALSNGMQRVSGAAGQEKSEEKA